MTKTVVITGAGSGIGRAIAMLLAERSWRVVVTDVDGCRRKDVAAALPADTGVRHESAVLNVSSPKDAASVALDVTDRLGLDAWVSKCRHLLHARLPRRTDRPLRPDDGPSTSRGLRLRAGRGRAMVRSGTQGAIVNTASMAGKQGRVPFLADYVASKFGVVGLTQAMAYELGEYGITVNCVCPGYVETPMQSRELEWEAQFARLHSRRRARHDDPRHPPCSGWSNPRTWPVRWRSCSPRTPRFITGEALAVNGGAYMD